MISRGLTLLEILLAIAVFGLILWLIFPLSATVVHYRKKVSTEEELERIKNGMMRYYYDVGNFPQSLTYLVWDPGVSGWVGPYVSATLDGIQKDEWERDYVYRISEASRTAIILSAGRDGICQTNLGSALGCEDPDTWLQANFRIDEDDIATEVHTLSAYEIKGEISKRRLKAIKRALEGYYRKISALYGPRDIVAQYSAAYGTPYCPDNSKKQGFSVCRVPPNLIGSRDNIPVYGSNDPRPEPNAPNTLDACPDGTSGDYLDDEHIDEIRLRPLNDFVLRAGDTLRVDVSAHCFWDDPDADYLDLYYDTLANAQAGVWTLHADNIVCPNAFDPGGNKVGGLRMFAFELVPSANPGIYAIRSQIEYGGKNPTKGNPCPQATDYEDRDDIVFTVFPPTYGNFFPPDEAWWQVLGFPPALTYDAFGNPLNYQGCTTNAYTAGGWYYSCDDCDSPPCDSVDPPFEAKIWSTTPAGDEIVEIAIGTPVRGQYQEPCQRGTAVSIFVKNHNNFPCIGVYRFIGINDLTDFTQNWEPLASTSDGDEQIGEGEGDWFNQDQAGNSIVCGDMIMVVEQFVYIWPFGYFCAGSPGGDWDGDGAQESPYAIDIFSVACPSGTNPHYHFVWVHEGKLWCE